MSNVENEPEQESRLARVLSNRWRQQLQALTDLHEFIAEHGPADRAPLAPLDWKVGQTRTVAAEIWQHSKKPMSVLRAYAAALGTEVQSTDLTDRVVHRARGRIGALEGAATHGRTLVIVVYTQWRDSSAEDAR